MKLRATSRTLFLAAVVASIALLGAAACSSPNGDSANTKNTTNITANNVTPPSKATPMTGGGGMESSPGATSAPYDLQFIDAMTAHHQSAIRMAEMAVGQAQHAELKSMARKIIDSQQKEVEQMKTWRDQWFAGKTQAVNMELPGMTDMQDSDMTKMESASGVQFDLAFLDLMIPHHGSAVTMSKDALNKAEHPEIKQLARKIIDDQQQEIGQMNKWKAAWSK